MAEIIELPPFEFLSAEEAEREGDRLLSDNLEQQALEYFNHALKLFNEQFRKRETANVHFKIGVLYNSINSAEIALSNFMEGLELVSALKDDNEIFRFQNRIGYFYQTIYQFANSHEYYNEALKTAIKLNDPSLMQEAYYNLGNCLNWMEDHKLAYQNLDKADELDTRNDLIKKKIYGSKAILLYKMKDYDRSLSYFKIALDLNEKTDNNIIFKASLLKSQGYVYCLLENYPEALHCLDEALSIAEKINTTNTLAIIHENYSLVYEKSGDLQKALKHWKKHKEYENLIVNESLKFKTRELQKKFDISESQKEKEIYRLKNIDLANANEKILNQKIELEEKNRNITDSIFYAGRLQKAILPPESLLNKYFSDSFILFQPKDIVSGDFYWFSGKNERLVLAAVDCTGHGVPGALMSMMGNNFLSSIVNTEGKTCPAEILQEMNKRTKASLQNKEASITANDGMDLALCSIDFKTNTLSFSGAYRPLVFIRNGKLQEIKADKKSIGGSSDFDTTFSQHEVQFETGDTFYIYSDGYADQFGGPKNRKFMGGKLKEFLSEISSKTMNEQQQLLTENHFSWRGNNEQVDDLLVIGFRF